MDALVVGCGLTGSVIARHLAEEGKKVTIWDKRNHIGGNMYDYTDEHGFLLQKYGPHTFHTNDSHLYDYMCQYCDWNDFLVTCGAVWDNKYTPTPFNFTTIDTFYPKDKAEELKEKLSIAYPGGVATVVEVLNSSDKDISEYAEYLFQNDYAPYTAKQWGISPSEIDPSVLKRVPLRFSYKDGYFDDTYQVMPSISFTHFFENLLNHPNITIELNIEALEHISIQNNEVYIDNNKANIPVIYTGALDELFENQFGRLPYRSLRFEWFYEDIDSKQEAPIVAYPQEADFTRITEYKKMPLQDKKGTVYAKEYPLQYEPDKGAEPYYPVLTKDSQEQYLKYLELANQVNNLHICGRLADFKYYNMDQALARVLEVCEML